ncbi:hypothetical protein KAR34_01075 [bacterium]|nr:hypothetical protein [bacterium]
MKRTQHFTNLVIALGIILMTGLTLDAKIKFIPLIDASLAINSAGYDAEYATEQTQTDDSDQQSTGENVYLYFAPNVSFSEIPGLWITPSFEFEFTGANNLLQLEDEAFVFQRRLNFYYLLGANYAFNRAFSAKLKGFGRIEKAQESNNETIDTGIYNYNDAGGWGELSAKYRLGVPMRSKLGYKAYGRRYPNYTNADFVKLYEEKGLTWPSDIPRDMHEKDINVNEFWLRQEFTWGKLPILTNAEVHIKGVNYVEMPVVNTDATLSDDLRQDGYMDVYLELPFYINKYHQLEIDYNYRIRYANTGYYDVGNGVYLGEYYNYRQNRPRLLYNFKLWFPIAGYLPRGSLSFAWQNRHFYSRPSLQKVSTDDQEITEYKWDDPHWESSLDFNITLRQQLFAEWFNLYFSFHSVSQTSNSNVEDNAPYNFKYNTFTLGTAVSF